MPEAKKRFEVINKDQIISRDGFHAEFDTTRYLSDFYSEVEDPAMQLVLTFLPNIAARIGNIENLLDFGAGPTINVAVAFRNTADNIYLADYLPQNRDELIQWSRRRSRFDWSNAIQKIATAEGTELAFVSQMEKEARSKVRGVFHCDCFKNPSVRVPRSLFKRFDVVTSIFCVEYCCNTIEEYKSAIANVVDQVKPGGYFMMGAILEETWCSFGGRKFSCLFITEDLVLSTLRDCDLLVDDSRSTAHFNYNGMLLICSRKKN